MPDDDETTTDGKQPRARRRRAAAAPEQQPGVVATPDPTRSELWTPDARPPAPPGGLRVARAGPTRSRAPISEPPSPTELVANVVAPAPSADVLASLPVDAPVAQAPPVIQALPVTTGPAGIDGVPGVYDDGAEWLRNGVKRHPWAIGVSLVMGWTGMWLALWGAAIGMCVGVLVALGVVDTTALGREVTNLGGGQAVTILSILGGLFFGAVGGFVAVVGYVLAATPWQGIVAVVSGAVVATIITVFTATFERLGLRIRGYRRLSRDEVRRVAPLVREVAEAMDVQGLPRFAMADMVIPNAWSHMRTIVITTGLLQTLDDAELRAVLAHELQHWRSGDAVGLHIVWAAAWPVAVTYNIGMIIAGQRPGMALGPPARFRGFLVLLGWIIAWPAWVILRLIIAPTVAASQRRYEYDADAAAARLGYATAMITALRKMGAFEGGRTGWEQAMTATHPPTELRIEALQAPKPDDGEYQEDDLHGPGWEEVGHVLRGLVRPRSARP